MNSHFKINKGCSLLLAIPLVKDNNINNTNNNTNNNNTDLSLVNNKYHHGQEIDPTPTTHENLDDIKIIVSSYKEKTDEINGLNKETEQTNSEILQQINNKTIKILIVEDNQINSKLLKMMITKIIETETTTIQNSDHYEIEVVNNPDEALSTITNNNFDIIFLDPPYKDKNYVSVLLKIKEKNLLAPNGILIIHRHKDEDDNLSLNFKILEEKKYGISKIFFMTF
jgi:CheY-like chemotaxis protein